MIILKSRKQFTPEQNELPDLKKNSSYLETSYTSDKDNKDFTKETELCQFRWDKIRKKRYISKKTERCRKLNETNGNKQNSFQKLHLKFVIENL